MVSFADLFVSSPGVRFSHVMTFRGKLKDKVCFRDSLIHHFFGLQTVKTFL